MTPILAYFLKINVALALFYIFYRLFCCKDTFFQWRRTALLSFFGIALAVPLLNFQSWVDGSERATELVKIYASVVLPDQVVTATQEAPVLGWADALLLLYLAGVALLVGRMLFQLAVIVRMHFRSEQGMIKGVRVHLLAEAAGPFSFFHWIFIHLPSHTPDEADEILAHEQAHVRQCHSIDVLVGELMCALCWFNPFVWGLKREVRRNLEYLADDRVLETGYDSAAYQYHLLGLAHPVAAANISNNFNVLPLKNRIRMMNKRRTNKVGRTKYLMFLPLAALLLMVSNIETVARTTKALAQDASAPVRLETTISPNVPDSVVFEVVEKMPEFPGGQVALMNYLANNIRYPQESQKAGTQGRVIVQFVVTKDGNIQGAKVKRSIDPYLDKEALRVVNAMPKWKPGMQRGQAVNVKYTVPILFRLGKSGAAATQQAKAEEIKSIDPMVVVGYGSADKKPAETVFTVVETMPKFYGGKAALMRYLSQHVKYPTIAQTNNEQGTVQVQMVVGRDGRVSDVKVARSVSTALDAEAMRVVSNMPRWEPGMQNGKAVAVMYTLPIEFKLDKK
ncbi:MAG: M56 family metallopeptidase [Mediterranea sp.]|jgi:TonB family protein|nr:M56 family metallopeptidase [Mediterranea sp.]